MEELPLTLPVGLTWALWHELSASARGPEPAPDWLVTRNAVDRELGVVKTGKEAEAFLVERSAWGSEESCLLVRKRYRPEYLQPRRAMEGMDLGRLSSRDLRALENKSLYGKFVLGQTWPSREFKTLVTLWEAGVPVPYPVTQVGSDIWMEFVCTASGDPAPRLSDTREADLEPLAEAVWSAAVGMSAAGVVHGDFSPFNVLVPAPGAIRVIDVPQAVDATSTAGLDLLQRDLDNFAAWFRRRGVSMDADEWFNQCVAEAFS
ncbi:MAG: RIO1 family regulatory kinase/ATPase [Arachnia sp.]